MTKVLNFKLSTPLAIAALLVTTVCYGPDLMAGKNELVSNNNDNASHTPIRKLPENTITVGCTGQDWCHAWGHYAPHARAV